MLIAVNDDSLTDMVASLNPKVGLVHQMPYVCDRKGFAAVYEKVRFSHGVLKTCWPQKVQVWRQINVLNYFFWFWKVQFLRKLRSNIANTLKSLQINVTLLKNVQLIKKFKFTKMILVSYFC